MTDDADYQVYLIEHEHGFVKIGRSIEPEQRYRSIRSYTPYTIELRTTLDAYDEAEKTKTGSSVENLLHRYYSSFRQKYEWFDLPEPEIHALVELDSIYATDLEYARLSLRNEAYEGRKRTIRDDLRDVWSLRARKRDPDGHMGEMDR